MLPMLSFSRTLLKLYEAVPVVCHPLDGFADALLQPAKHADDEPDVEP